MSPPSATLLNVPDLTPRTKLLESVKLWLAIALAVYALWHFQ